MTLMMRCCWLLALTFISILAYAKPIGKYPPSIVELTFDSYGSRMSGLAYLAAGQGPHPTILLLHGYPGNEKNLDVAQAMRSKGWNVIFFHYRGAWGSEGEFSYQGAEQDVQVVLKYLYAPANAEQLRIDTTKISIVGHSMGGHMAIAGILDNPDVVCAVAYDGANMGAEDIGFMADPKMSKVWSAYADTLFMLNGWSAEKEFADIKKHGKQLNLLNRVTTINARPVMLVAANTDVIPMALHIEPLHAALQATPNSKVSFKLLEDDHSFSASRAELIAITAEFLNKHCK